MEILKFSIDNFTRHMCKIKKCENNIKQAEKTILLETNNLIKYEKEKVNLEIQQKHIIQNIAIQQPELFDDHLFIRDILINILLSNPTLSSDFEPCMTKSVCEKILQIDPALIEYIPQKYISIKTCYKLISFNVSNIMKIPKHLINFEMCVYIRKKSWKYTDGALAYNFVTTYLKSINVKCTGDDKIMTFSDKKNKKHKLCKFNIDDTISMIDKHNNNFSILVKNACINYINKHNNNFYLDENEYIHNIEEITNIF